MYVVDPQVAGMPIDFSLLVSGLGVQNGRVLTDELPADWFERASIAIRSLSTEVERSLATHYLTQLRTDATKFGRTGLRASPSKDWLDAASASTAYFRAIAVAQAEDIPATHSGNVTSVSDLLSGAHPLWETTTTRTFPARERETLEIVLPLVALAGKSLVMDPYFGRDRDSVKLAAALVGSLNRDYEIEFHSHYEVGSKRVMASADPSVWESQIRSHLGPATTRSGAKVTVVRWKPRSRGGDKLHKRWIVNKRGGISLDRGLYLRDKQTNVADLVDVEWARHEYHHFKTRTKIALSQHRFELVDEIEI